MKDLIIIKLGGSVITDKSSLEKFKDDVLEQLLRQIKELSENYDFLIVHGSGSFGHSNVKKLEVENIVGPDKRHEVSIIMDAMDRLNHRIVKKFLEFGLSPVRLSGRAFCYKDEKRNLISFIECIKKYLERGLIPITHGGMISEGKSNFSIISSDEIVFDLAKKLSPNRVIFVGDTNGVYKDPAKGEETIPEINKENISEILNFVGEAGGNDVTGGMREKIKTLTKLMGKVQIDIINGNLDQELIKCIRKNGHSGTKIT